MNSEALSSKTGSNNEIELLSNLKLSQELRLFILIFFNTTVVDYLTKNYTVNFTINFLSSSLVLFRNKKILKIKKITFVLIFQRASSSFLILTFLFLSRSINLTFMLF